MKGASDPNRRENAESLSEVALRDHIEKRAYHIWLASGGHHGEDLRHWLQAEAEPLKAISRDQAERSSSLKSGPTVKQRSSAASNEGIAKE